MPYTVATVFFGGFPGSPDDLQAQFYSHGDIALEDSILSFTLTNSIGANENYFKVLSDGWWSFRYDAVPDGFRGGVLVYDSNEGTILAALSVTPEADEYPGRIIGLVGGNQVVRDPIYDGNNNLTSATIRVYDTSAHANTDDGVTGLLRTYTLTTAYDGNARMSKQTTRG